MPSAISTSDRQAAWASIQPSFCPLAARLASENGRAAPTRNENDGWMRSCSEQPAHAACVWWNARNSQKERVADRDAGHRGQFQDLRHHQEHDQSAIGVERGHAAGGGSGGGRGGGPATGSA